MKITFRPEGHAYEVDGRVVPSVTQILGTFNHGFDRVDPEILRAKQQLGTAVHRACELDDDHCLDVSSLHDKVRPYLDAWRKFRGDTKCEVIGNEQVVYHRSYDYIGTADRLLRLNSKKTVVDIKTGVRLPWAALQTAGYAMAWEDMNSLGGPFGIVKCESRASIHLHDDGTYDLYPHTDPADRNTFLAALQLSRWMRKTGAQR